MYNDRISAVIADAAKFVAAFATPIVQSVPHIYLSSISFAPKRSIIAETYRQKYTKIVSINSGKAINWPAIQNVLHGHSGHVNSVAFSPDGSRIVSGSLDDTIRLWDAETGDAIGKPLQGHSTTVYSVASSPDGSRIVSGSRDNTIRLWDAETSDAIGKPLEGHSSIASSVAFSPDGSRIVSGSLDNTIHLWNAKISDVVSTLGCTGYSQLLPSGWVVNSGAEKLFWVPPSNRAGLCFPRNTMTMSREGVSTTLDMSRFVHGTAWETCRTG
jgi:WD40 repeat protein